MEIGIAVVTRKSSSRMEQRSGVHRQFQKGFGLAAVGMVTPNLEPSRNNLGSFGTGSLRIARPFGQPTFSAGRF